MGAPTARPIVTRLGRQTLLTSSKAIAWHFRSEAKIEVQSWIYFCTLKVLISNYLWEE